MRANNTTVGPIREAAKAARALRRDMNALVPFLSGAYRNGFESGYITGLTPTWKNGVRNRPPMSWPNGKNEPPVRHQENDDGGSE
jgi:hypothetical protein